MLNLINHHENASLNHHEIVLCTYQNSYTEYSPAMRINSAQNMCIKQGKIWSNLMNIIKQRCWTKKKKESTESVIKLYKIKAKLIYDFRGQDRD